MGRLDQRVVIVTGAAQGLGEAIALEVAREGASWVTVVDQQEERGTAVKGSRRS